MHPRTNSMVAELERAKAECPKSSYVIYTECNNCGHGAIVTIRKGQTVGDYKSKQKCPYCGCPFTASLLFS
jgi:hypothetical protein